MTRSFYEILEVEPTVSGKRIKLAYYKLALQWHPDSFDRGNSPAKTREEAEARFKEIGQAYEVLSDPRKRQSYDDCGFSFFNENDFSAWHSESLSKLYEEIRRQEEERKRWWEKWEKEKEERREREEEERKKRAEEEKKRRKEWEETLRRREEQEKRDKEYDKKLKEEHEKRIAEIERETEQRIQEGIAALKKEEEERKKEWEEKIKEWEEWEKLSKEWKIVYDLPEWTVLNGSWMRGGTLVKFSENKEKRLEYGKDGYDREKEEILKKIRNNKKDWEVKKVRISENKEDVLMVHCSLYLRELRNKNNGDLFPLNENGEFIINEEVCGRVHWESGFGRAERQEIYQAITESSPTSSGKAKFAVIAFFILFFSFLFYKVVQKKEVNKKIVLLPEKFL